MEKKRHYAIWITGLPGSGKTNIGKYFHKKFEKKYGPTLFFNGDDIRRIFKIKSYDLFLSISDEKDYSIAFTIIQKK